MKNKSIVVLILSILVVLGCGNDMSNTSGGAGGKNSDTGQSACTTKVGTYEDFNKIREDLACNYTLTADIDFEMRTDFEPIGTKDKPFTGVLDGAGYTIKNVKIEKSDTDNVGVIGYAKGASIKNLTFENVSIKGKQYVGVIGITGGSSISKVYVKRGTIGSDEGSPSYVGGLVGTAGVGSTITNSYSAATVKGDSYIGGLVGSNFGTIESSYATGMVTGSSSVGGLAGRNSGTIENSYSSSTVTGSSIVGGLAGSNSGTIENSYATGAVITTSRYKGGLVGTNSGAVTNGYYDKTSTGQMDTDKGTGVSGKANIVKRDDKYYDSKGTPSEDDDVEIFKGWDFASVWVFTAGAWPKLAWQTN